MAKFVPISVAEFRFDITGEQLKNIQTELRSRELPVRNNIRLDAMEYYRAVSPEYEVADISEDMFVATCRMNEYFEGRTVDVLRIESIVEGEITDAQGGSAAAGIRVFYRETVASRPRKKR